MRIQAAGVRRIVVLNPLAIAVLVFFAVFGGVRPTTAQTATSTPASESATIPSGQKFIMQLETPLHTRTTRKGDHVEFATAADVIVDDQVLIPNKSLVRATVTKAKRAGLLAGRAEIQLQFEDVRLADGTVVPIKATITRMGFDPVDQSGGENPKLKGEAGAGADAKTVATGAAEGAIIGVLTGGAKGAAYGAAAGAAISAIGMALKRGPDLDLPRSTMFEAKFDKPIDIPAKSLQAQNTSKPAPGAGTQVADASSDAERTGGRPVLKIVHREKPPADVATSEPADTPRATPQGESSDTPRVEPPDSAQSMPPAETKNEPSPVETAAATIQVKVRMVQVDAVVRDRAGRMIDNLTLDDFRVYEDGVLQDIQSFSHDELPIAVALVVDRSGSVGPYISELRRIADRALDQLKPRDEVCLFSFADTVNRIEDLTTDRRRIADALDRIRAGGGTDITDAVHDAVNYLARSAPGRRHAVVLISDNQQTLNPQASESETIRTAMETETVVYSLKTSGESLQLAAQLPSLILRGNPVGKVTQETGGEIINVKGTSSLDAALGSVISRLRMRYSLGYYPSGTAQGGAFHAIAVRLTDKHGKAGSDYFMHSKRGYYATGGSTTSTTVSHFASSDLRKE
ncbi:MAG TPA: VWA domain-containing protein [Acidobacteriota bacterium]|nr:VWA domain-containing protein [Acidobacteriota bacterium]